MRKFFEYWTMFNRIDTSSDRRISLEEFKKAVPMINEWGITIANPEKTFKEIDKDGAGKYLKKIK